MRVVTSADFKTFDWENVTLKHRGRLPHLTQAGAIYFVTFRLADSIPLQVAQQLNADKATWLSVHPVPWTPEQEREYHRKFTMRLERWLDAGRGSCVLRTPDVRAEVEASLLHDHGKRHNLGDFVIMPNHVHLLIQPLDAMPLSKLLGPMKGASSRRINERLQQNGTLWMDESFDHIVRGMDSLKKFRQYIANNPVKANLPADSFTYKQRWIVQ